MFPAFDENPTFREKLLGNIIHSTVGPEGALIMNTGQRANEVLDPSDF